MHAYQLMHVWEERRAFVELAMKADCAISAVGTMKQQAIIGEGLEIMIACNVVQPGLKLQS